MIELLYFIVCVCVGLMLGFVCCLWYLAGMVNCLRNDLLDMKTSLAILSRKQGAC